MDKDKDATIREYKPGAIWKNYVAMIRVVALLVTGLQYADFFHLHVSVASICPSAGPRQGTTIRIYVAMIHVAVLTLSPSHCGVHG